MKNLHCTIVDISPLTGEIEVTADFDTNVTSILETKTDFLIAIDTSHMVMLRQSDDDTLYTVFYAYPSNKLAVLYDDEGAAEPQTETFENLEDLLTFVATREPLKAKLRTFDIDVTYYSWETGNARGEDNFIVDALTEDEAKRQVSNSLWQDGVRFSIDKVTDVTAVYSGIIVG